jgi:DNA-binding response OmpR family regulator
MMQLIFVIDGEMETRTLAHQSLEQAGYVVHTFSTIRVIEDAEQRCPALMLIAAKLPDGSGLDLCKTIRQHPVLSSTRIVLVTDVSDDKDRAQGLECGADDCVTKPFTGRELVARVRAVLRHLAAPISSTSGIDSAELLIDSSAMKLSVRGNEVATTTLEFRLIDYLARHRGQVFTRDALLDAVWGDMQFVTPRSVDACVRRIREKIEPDRTVPSYLKTIRGVGYRLDAMATWRSDNYELCTCPVCTASKNRSRMLRPDMGRWRRMPRPEA